MKTVSEKTAKVIGILDSLCISLESCIDNLYDQSVRIESDTLSREAFDIQELYLQRIENYEQVLNTMKIEISELLFYGDKLSPQDLYSGASRIAQLYNFVFDDFKSFSSDIKNNPNFPNTFNKLDWH